MEVLESSVNDYDYMFFDWITGVPTYHRDRQVPRPKGLGYYDPRSRDSFYSPRGKNVANWPPVFFRQLYGAPYFPARAGVLRTWHVLRNHRRQLRADVCFGSETAYASTLCAPTPPRSSPPIVNCAFYLPHHVARPYRRLPAVL